MDWLATITARIAKWAAYSDYCLNSDFGLPHCRAFWIWAGILGAVAATVLAAYIAWHLLRGGGEERCRE